MEIFEKNLHGYHTLQPVGELDANSSLMMDEKICALNEQKITRIHVDCSELTYISSAGLGVFISYLDELQAQGGMFVFSGMRPNVQDVFELLGLDRMVTILKSAEELKGLSL